MLAKGSAYSHNSIHGATDEGYTQVIDILEYTTPDKVCITTAVLIVGGWGGVMSLTCYLLQTNLFRTLQKSGHFSIVFW